MKLKSISAILISIGISFIYSYILSLYFNQVSTSWWYSLVFFTALFVILNLLYFVKTDGKTFTGILLASGVIKFLASCVFIAICFFTQKGGFFAFFLHFIGHYILFTVFEMRYLLQLIKKQSK